MTPSLPPLPSQYPSVSVVVPAHQAGRTLLHCFSSLAALVPSPVEIILVSDGEDAAIAALAAKFGATLVGIPTPGGPAHARNRGAACARGDLLFFIDSDVTVRPDAIERVRSIFLRDSQLAAVFGSYDDQPARRNFLSQYRNLFHHYVHQTSREEASTFWGACGAIRREIFVDVGGFDERYRRPSIEDVELGGRLKKGGYKILLCKTLQCKHLKCWSMGSLLKSDFFDRALPWTNLILQNRTLVNDLNLKWSYRLSIALVWASLFLLITAFRQPQFLWIAAAFLAAFSVLNYPLYRFFYTKRGFWFMIRAVPWHVVYYLSCGLAFAIGFGRAFFKGSLLMPGK